MSNIANTVPVLEYREQKQVVPSNCFLPSITELDREPLAPEVKSKVLDYMLNAGFRGWRMVGGYSDTDAFTGEPMHTYSTQLNDGTYKWFDNLAMYVYRYDIRLPEEFIAHILAFYDADGQVNPFFDCEKNCPTPGHA